MNIKEMGEKIGLDEEDYAELLELFFESGGADLAKLKAAIGEGSAEQAHEAAHSLKGSSGGLGLDKVFDLTKAIDDKAREGIIDGLNEMTDKLFCEYELLRSDFANYKAG